MRHWVIALCAIVALALVACNEEAAPASEDLASGEPEMTESSSVNETSAGESGTAMIGAKAPAITVANSLNNDGAVPNLEDYIGQVVVLDYWAYW